ncbi:MAG TPA: hypothetical protein VK031_07850 [Tissierellaceae bacterium]|nr:hypothetical protein [Tissierellaceae bacterium]
MWEFSQGVVNIFLVIITLAMKESENKWDNLSRLDHSFLQKYFHILNSK